MDESRGVKYYQGKLFQGKYLKTVMTNKNSQTFKEIPAKAFIFKPEVAYSY